MKINNKEISTTKLINVLRKANLAKQVAREIVIDQILENVNLDEMHIKELLETFKRSRGITSNEEYIAFMKELNVDETLLIEVLTRPDKVVKFRDEKWGDTVNSLYLKYKEKNDLITYNMLKSSEFNVMQEIYFRLKDGEETWDSMMRKLNPHLKEVKYQYGPIKADTINEVIMQKMVNKGIDNITEPFTVDGVVIIAEMKVYSIRKLDNDLKDSLLKNVFDDWLAEHLKKTFETMEFSK